MKKPRNKNICFDCEHFQIEAGGAVWTCDIDGNEIPYKAIGLEPPKKCPHLKQQCQIIYRKSKICDKCDSCVRYKNLVFNKGEFKGQSICKQCLVSDNFFVDSQMWKYCEVDKRCPFYTEYLMGELNENLS